MSRVIGERFVSLVWDAMKNPECANQSALLTAANEFLDATAHESGPMADTGRKLGNLAMNHAVFGGDVTELRYTAGMLAMHGHLNIMAERIAKLEQ